MNFLEAAASGKPFYHDEMIGAYLMIDGNLYHRDNLKDFQDIEWIKKNCKGWETIATSDLFKRYKISERGNPNATNNRSS